jgi:hypothetical protein
VPPVCPVGKPRVCPAAPILELARSITFWQHPVREMLMSRSEFPWKRTLGACRCSGQRTSRSFSSVACLNRSTRVLSKSVTTDNILTWNCCKHKLDAVSTSHTLVRPNSGLYSSSMTSWVFRRSRSGSSWICRRRRSTARCNARARRSDPVTESCELLHQRLTMQRYFRDTFRRGS